MYDDKLTEEQAHAILDAVKKYDDYHRKREDLIKELRFIAEARLAVRFVRAKQRLPSKCANCGAHDYDDKFVMFNEKLFHPYICWRKP